MLALITSCALLAAQTPIDETNAESTIKVLKKEKKNTETPATAPPPPPAPVVAQNVAPPPAVVRAAPAAPAQVLEASPPRPTKVVPWVVLGGSVLATAVGVFFAVRTTQAINDQSQLEFEINTKNSRVTIPEEFSANQKAIFINSIAATVLISAGVSGTVASSVALAD